MHAPAPPISMLKVCGDIVYFFSTDLPATLKSGVRGATIFFTSIQGVLEPFIPSTVGSESQFMLWELPGTS